MEEGWGKIQKWNIVINGENKRDEFKERRNTKIPTKCREAKACFEQGAALFADNVEFLFDYAQFLIEEGLSNEAIKLLERILQLDPSATPARELLENLM